MKITGGLYLDDLLTMEQIIRIVNGTCEVRLDASPFVQNAASCWIAIVSIHMIICWLVGSVSVLIAFMRSETTFELVYFGKLEYRPGISFIAAATISLSASLMIGRYIRQPHRRCGRLVLTHILKCDSPIRTGT